MSASRIKESNEQSTIDVVAATLENYARRGVFRGFSRGPVENGKASFRMVWHRDRVFDFVLDMNRHTMRFPEALPNVPADSAMYNDLKSFIKTRHSAETPDHRRIDTRKAQVLTANRRGNVTLTLKVRNGDYEYGARKAVHLVHEIFMTFLLDGKYYDYMVETFDLDPDRM